MAAFVPSVSPLAPGVHHLRSVTTSTRRVAKRPTRRAVIRAAAAPVEVEADTFATEVLQSDVPVLVDFYAPWCGPCKLVAPLMDWVATEFDGKVKVVKIHTEENDNFTKEYGIHGLPTFAVFKGGVAYGVQEGAMGKKDLEKYIRTHVPELGPMAE